MTAVDSEGIYLDCLLLHSQEFDYGEVQPVVEKGIQDKAMSSSAVPLVNVAKRARIVIEADMEDTSVEDINGDVVRASNDKSCLMLSMVAKETFCVLAIQSHVLLCFCHTP